MVPLIKAVVKTMVPTHSWSYERLLQSLHEEDFDLTDDEEEDAEEGKSHTPIYADRTKQRTDHFDLAHRLENPSIQLYPRRPELVKLEQVQHLGDVFERLYEEENQLTEAEAARPTRPRPSYRRYL